MARPRRHPLTRSPRSDRHPEDDAVTAPPEIGWATALGDRTENQDRARTGAGWLVVCDGVGGQAGGARAAALAAEAAATVLAGSTGPSPVREAIRAAHGAVRGGQVDDPQVHDMATTVTVARATTVGPSTSRWAVAHVGDSPAWWVGGGQARQLTADHTVAGELLAAGAIDPTAAADHPGRRFVTRVAGARDGVEPDVVEVDLGPGAALVAATDGVSDVLGTGVVAAVVSGAPTAAAAARALVEAAGDASSGDNATAIVVRQPPGPAT